MDHYQRIAQHFQGSIEAAAMAVDTFAEPLARAAELVAESLLSDRKVMVCGAGADAALAQLFVSHMQSPPERERPALPAINLAGDGATLSALATSGPEVDLFAAQVRALGQSGDTLLCINSAAGANGLAGALRAATERNLSIVLVSNGDDGQLPSLAGDGAAVLLPAATRRGHVIELQAGILNCLCQLVENNLFGEEY